MRAMLAAIAVLSFAGAAHAQQWSVTAQGSLQPLSGLADESSAYVEIFGSLDYRAYIMPAVAPGKAFEALAARSATLSAAFLSPFTQATISFAYDPAAAVVQSVTGNNGAVRNYYDAIGFSVQLTDTLGATHQLTSATSQVFVREGGTSTSNVFGVLRTDASFPPPPIAGGLVYGDASPQSFTVDLKALIESDVCVCSPGPLPDTSALGPLPVRLVGPTSYRPLFMGLQYIGTRLPGDAADSALPDPFQPARYDRVQSFDIAFDGEFAMSVQRADYGSDAAFEQAKSWIAANVPRIDFEQVVRYNITSTQVSAVPEPATLALWAVGGLLLLGRRRRQFRND